MSINIYKWSDVDAPSLSRIRGSLINVLDACLVNGYGTKASSGWTKEYAETNMAIYRMPEGSRCYLYVNDNMVSYYNNAEVNGYATINTSAVTIEDAITSGTEQFSNHSRPYWWKNNNTDTPGGWEVYATDKCFYLIGGYATTEGTSTWYDHRNLSFFGDYNCTSSGFPYNTMISHATNTSTYYFDDYNHMVQGQQFNSSGKYCRRGWNHIDQPTTIEMKSPIGAATWVGSHAEFDYPDKLTGACHIDRIKLIQDKTFMGYMPGLYSMLHSTTFTYPFTFEGSGAFSGKTFDLTRIYGATLVFQTNGDWYEQVV